MQRLAKFVSQAAKLSDWTFQQVDGTKWRFNDNGELPLYFTTERERALQDEDLQLLGLEHPIVIKMIEKYSAFNTSSRALAGKITGLAGDGLLTIWKINTQGRDGQANHHIVRIGMTNYGDRASWLERLGDKILALEPPTGLSLEHWRNLAMNKKQRLQELLHSELSYSGMLDVDMSYSATLLAIVGIET